MCFALAAMSPSDSLPTDLDGLRALLLAERAHHAEELERLTAIIKELQRHRFGRRAEPLDPEQLALALEDVEQTLAAADAAAENDPTAQKQPTPRMCWSPNMPITRRSIVKRKSMHAKASRSIAPPWRTG